MNVRDVSAYIPTSLIALELPPNVCDSDTLDTIIGHVLSLQVVRLALRGCLCQRDTASCGVVQNKNHDRISIASRIPDRRHEIFAARKHCHRKDLVIHL